MAKDGIQTQEVTRSQECVALGARRACRRASVLRLLAAYRMLALHQRYDV